MKLQLAKSFILFGLQNVLASRPQLIHFLLRKGRIRNGVDISYPSMLIDIAIGPIEPIKQQLRHSTKGECQLNFCGDG